ncbi:MAG: AGE family epimerase/isomerase, partial [Spirochaetia bacterium]|nr:AGE family epimerase/isomerase [Spirochaetia bacterium]
MDAKFYQSVKDELFNSILPYWEKYARDPVNKGFYGQIDNDNNLNTTCERSIVMTSRFLWTYSAVARLSKNPEYLKMADFAYQVILTKYWDKKHGGVYWSVMPNGKPKVSKKQIYGEAFCCYGLSEYAAALKELRETIGGESLPLVLSTASAVSSRRGEGGESLPLAPASKLSSATPSAGDT